MIDIFDYTVVSVFLLILGICGLLIHHKSIITVLMSIELILLSVNINMISMSVFLGNIQGQIFALFILGVSAAEIAIGLAILLVYFRNRGSIIIKDINLMKG